MILKENIALLVQTDSTDKDGYLLGTSKSRKTRSFSKWTLNSYYCNQEGKLIQRFGYMICDNEGGIILNKYEYEKANYTTINELMESGLNQVMDIFPNFSHQQKKKREKPKKMSDRTKTKIRDKVKSWYASEIYKKKSIEKVHFSLMTLTLTEKVTDRDIVMRILNNYVTKLRDKYGKFPYLWVAEKQDGKRNKFAHSTDNIHFHFFVSRYFPIQVINKIWLDCLKAENLRHDSYLNPVDIKAIKNLKSLPYYLTKYITKNDSEMDGIFWHCSRSISKISTGIYLTCNFDNFCETIVNFDGVIHCVNEFCKFVRFEAQLIHRKLLESVYIFNKEFI